jgi:hypothetical protein
VFSIVGNPGSEFGDHERPYKYRTHIYIHMSYDYNFSDAPARFYVFFTIFVWFARVLNEFEKE